MDGLASTFRDMTAKIKRVDYTAVLKDTSVEDGTVKMKRAGSKDVRMLIEFGEPNPRAVAFEKTTLRVYYPRISTVDIYDLGKQRTLIDQFLLLGFGSTSVELKRNYALKLIGEAQIEDQPATLLELIPLAPSVLQYLKRAELWLSSGGYPVQQKFDQPSGDYTQITYSEVKVNPNLSDDALRLKLPANVKRQYPQK